MKFTLCLILIAWSFPCFSQTADEGNYVVVRGAVQGCEHWYFRILDVVKIQGPETISLLGIPDIPVTGLDTKQIRLNLVSEIERRMGTAPKTVRIEILESDQQYEGIIDEYMRSLSSFTDKKCLYSPNKRPGWEGKLIPLHLEPHERQWPLEEPNER